jgi:iron complex transport system permease protein
MIIMAIILMMCLICSLGLGRFPVDPLTVLEVLFSKLLPIKETWSSQVETVIINIRFPRVIMGCFIGAGLSCAGCAYQGIFQNPMASPDILGASNGAGFGAATGLFLGFGYQRITLTAFAGGLCAIAIVLLISSKVHGNQTLCLILSGIMIGSLASAGISYIKLVADPTNTLPAITYWLMGSLASIRTRDMCFAAPLIFFGSLLIVLCRWKINVMTVGDEEAVSMGINVKHLRISVVICATLITAACVSICGMIGWVGLVIPHFARIMVGNSFCRSLPASLFLGGSFMMIVDNFARLIATSEIPIGILTAFVGAPFFLYLIIKEGNKF